MSGWRRHRQRAPRLGFVAVCGPTAPLRMPRPPLARLQRACRLAARACQIARPCTKRVGAAANWLIGARARQPAVGGSGGSAGCGRRDRGSPSRALASSEGPVAASRPCCSLRGVSRVIPDGYAVAVAAALSGRGTISCTPVAGIATASPAVDAGAALRCDFSPHVSDCFAAFLSRELSLVLRLRILVDAFLRCNFSLHVSGGFARRSIRFPSRRRQPWGCHTVAALRRRSLVCCHGHAGRRRKAPPVGASRSVRSRPSSQPASQPVSIYRNTCGRCQVIS